MGHTGDLCQSCVDNYYQKDDRCYKCPAYAVALFIVLIILMVCFALLLLKLARKSTAYFTSLSVGFNFVQVVAVRSQLQLSRLHVCDVCLSVRSVCEICL